ncbi:MAG: Nuclease SbcCD subunit [Pseudonocardiales bacterium]|nr:Nuclease SbcCD subunit [Pseudonocardiales bacterium]
MRFIHTSDWHLGRSLHGEPLLDAQATFLTWLLALARAEQVDAVVVAGDIYDRAVPQLDAVRLLDEALAGFADAGIPIVITGGNHDSAVRLGFGRALNERAGVHLRTSLDDVARPVILTDAHGPVAVYGIPYLLPDAVMEQLGVSERSHFAALSAAAELIRADARSRAVSRVVVAAHAFVTGGVGSESERDIRIGGIGDTSVSAFDGFTYVALGHLHGPQRVSSPSAATMARYSGSPLAFSFSERNHAKSVTLVEVGALGEVEVQLVPAPVPRVLREVRGRLDDLVERAGTDLGELAEAWVKVVLTDPTRPSAAMERLRAVWPHVLLLDFAPDQERVSAATDLERMAQTNDPVDICSLFVEWVGGSAPTSVQRGILQSTVEAASAVEAAR